MADFSVFDERSMRLLIEDHQKLRAEVANLRRIAGRISPINGTDSSGQFEIIDVKNSTGADRAKGEIVALGAPITTPSVTSYMGPMRQLVHLDGVAINLTSTPAQWFRFAVYLERVPGLSPYVTSGKALVAGTVPVKVNVTSTVHQYARPTTSDHTQLTSDWWGGAKIMQTVASTGSQYLYVQLGHGESPIYRGKTDSAHNKSASGTVSVWTGIGSGKSDSGADISSVYNPMANVGSGKFVDVAWIEGPELIAAEC